MQRVLLVAGLLAAGLGLSAWIAARLAAGLAVPTLIREPAVAVAVGLSCLLAAVLSRPATAAGEAARLWAVLERASPWLAVVAALALLRGAWRHASCVAGGADSSGYVSQAFKWASGRILTEVPLAFTAPWPDAAATLAPLGYWPAPWAGTLAPTYSAGLPLMMAASARIAGPAAVYAVVPLTALLLLAAVYHLGRVLSGPAGGLVATVLVAASPVVLFTTFLPFSDLPAAAFWVAATAVAVRPPPRASLLAGLLAAIAILVRPNLVPLALPLAGFLAGEARGRRRALARLALFALGAAPGVVLTGLVNATFWGSPLRSGYGGLGDIYSWRHLSATLAAYPARALDTHTAFLALGLAAPFLVRPSDGSGRRRAVALFLLAMALAGFLCYAFYPPFDDWWYLRFLTAALVWLLVLAAAALVGLAGRLPAAARAPAVVLATAALGGTFLGQAGARGVFASERSEVRYLAVSRWVDDHLPRQAVLVSMQESGALSHYTGRTVLRFDLVPPQKLDRAMRFFRDRGYASYIVLDCIETTAFALRFQGQSHFASLDWPPRLLVGGRNGCVRVYDPADRARYRARETVVTERIRD